MRSEGFVVKTAILRARLPQLSEHNMPGKKTVDAQLIVVYDFLNTGKEVIVNKV